MLQTTRLDKVGEAFLKKCYAGGFDKRIMEAWESFRTQMPSVTLLLELIPVFKDANADLTHHASDNAKDTGAQVGVKRIIAVVVDHSHVVTPLSFSRDDGMLFPILSPVVCPKSQCMAKMMKLRSKWFTCHELDEATAQSMEKLLNGIPSNGEWGKRHRGMFIDLDTFEAPRITFLQECLANFVKSGCL